MFNQNLIKVQSPLLIMVSFNLTEIGNVFLHSQYIVTVFLLCLSGSQAVVSLLLQRELSSVLFSLVAEEVSE